MWRAQYEDQRTVVDLAETAPDQVFLQGTSAGLVVVDGAAGAVDATDTEPYLADISADGRLTPRGHAADVRRPRRQPRGTWLVRSPAGTLGGEVTSVSTLSAQAVGAGDEVVLDAPEGWGFANGTWTWEDDETLICGPAAGWRCRSRAPHGWSAAASLSRPAAPSPVPRPMPTTGDLQRRGDPGRRGRGGRRRRPRRPRSTRPSSATHCGTSCSATLPAGAARAPPVATTEAAPRTARSSSRPTRQPSTTRSWNPPTAPTAGGSPTSASPHA